MHWILQENIYKETGHDSLVQVLERTGTPHTFVKVVPFVGEIEPDLTLQNPVVCFGQYSMRHAARRKGWNPGVWDLDHVDYSDCLKNWGHEMLNADSQVFALKDFESVVHDKGDAFFRPSGDSKHFCGGIHTYEYISGLVKMAMSLKEDEVYYGLTPETLIVRSPVKEIYAEYRTWFVGGKLVTASQYRLGDRVVYSSVIDNDILAYAEKMEDIWHPQQAFVLDVCRTDAGLRIVEINTMNSAGFYAADVYKIFEAVEAAGENLRP